MAIPKVAGIETEYGIAATGARDFNPVLGSSLLIAGYAGDLRRIRWDYDQESPMRDARIGAPVAMRESPDDDAGLANVNLPNGARYYVDHAHPEYSTPECLLPSELVAHDKAGERILERSLAAYQATLPPNVRVALYKNNSDGKGNSYGTHENYLVDRALPFADLARWITTFLVTRQIFTGAGKVGSETGGPTPFQLTQRADFFEAEIGLETTLKRPIVNTRDEPHADPDRYRRLHVIVGDANLCEVATFLKIGTTALVLRMLEDAAAPLLAHRVLGAERHDVGAAPRRRAVAARAVQHALAVHGDVAAADLDRAHHVIRAEVGDQCVARRPVAVQRAVRPHGLAVRAGEELHAPVLERGVVHGEPARRGAAVVGVDPVRLVLVPVEDGVGSAR